MFYSDPNLSSDERSVIRWFDTSAFAQPAAYQFGNQGVGLLRAAGLVTFDVSVLRAFHIKERLGMEVRGEFFNAPEQDQFRRPRPGLWRSRIRRYYQL